MSEKFYITTAIAYTSKKPHIGNTYEVVLADAIARYKRLKGYDVYFLTGTDEHGQKIEECAMEEGIPPKDYVDKIAKQIRDICDLMNVSYDQFIRTTDENHKKTVQDIFKKLYEQGDIYKSEYQGEYCIACEAFFTQTQLTEGKCPDCGKGVTTTSEEAYFFKMGKYQDRLMNHINKNDNFIVPFSRKKEMVNNFLKPGLQDLCVSRTSFKWGIPVEFDPHHVVYVWIDALSNYITALGYNVDNSPEKFYRYWPADVHIIGKDILRFHTIYWPIILMALGLELPKQILGHPWLLLGKDKMSKSTGNVIYADDLVNMFCVDSVRYYMLSEMPYGQDGVITYENLITRYNSDLANTIGNLVNRSVTMCHKYFNARLEQTYVTEDIDKELIDIAIKTNEDYQAEMDNLHVSNAIEAVLNLARRSNKYIDETTPWILFKQQDKQDRLKQVMFNLIESIRYIAVLLSPIMPETSNEIFKQINTKMVGFDSLLKFGSNDINEVLEPQPLFLRINEEQKLSQINDNIVSDKLSSKEKIEGVCISIEDFQKVSLCVAKINACEHVEKSDKLYKLQLDDGTGERHVVSGIAKNYTKEQLVGKNVIIVDNLKPIKLRGVLSNGMILAADDGQDIKVIFVDDSIKVGSKIR